MNMDFHQKKPELGQVWTPMNIAEDMARRCFALNPSIKKVLDPACGPGTFSQAIYNTGAKNIEITSYDLDRRMKIFTAELNKKLMQKGKVTHSDYLLDHSIENFFDLVIMNPPYIRHELLDIDKKNLYYRYLEDNYKLKIDRRSNLYALFLLKSLIDLKKEGLLCAIIYDSIDNSSYGKKLIEILNSYSELIDHQMVRTPFEKVIIDAQIILLRKRQVPIKNFNESTNKTKEGFALLGELLNIKRGVSFPLRKIFLANKGDIFYSKAKSIFIKQSTLSDLVVEADQRAYLNCDANSKKNYELLMWLKNKAKKENILIKKFNIKEVSGKILFNYYIRNSPRHLWNPKSICASDNFYVSTVNNNFPPEVAWLLLNSDLYIKRIMAAARNQGNGLSKLQLYEYRNVVVPDWRIITDEKISLLLEISNKLILNKSKYEFLRSTASAIALEAFNEKTINS